jgi:hypothetical protein
MTADRSKEPLAERHQCAISGHSGGSEKLVLSLSFVIVVVTVSFSFSFSFSFNILSCSKAVGR